MSFRRALALSAAACLLFGLAAEPSVAQLNPESLTRKVAGNEYMKRREYEAARDQYLEALRLSPEYSDVHYNLGVLFDSIRAEGRVHWWLGLYRYSGRGGGRTRVNLTGRITTIPWASEDDARMLREFAREYSGAN